MDPLTRPHTPESAHSWWSDRNPLGPTISIHAAAKPLMRIMYHEQVRTFIKKNRSAELSRATMDVCFSYLAFKYISSATKLMILKELATRAKGEKDARIMVQAIVLQWQLIVKFLDSSDPQVRLYTCSILGTLASYYDSTTWALGICPRIVSLLSDEDMEVRDSALHAIVQLSETPDGAQAVRDTKIWEYFPVNLDSSNSQIRGYICTILVNLSNYQVENLPKLDSSDQDIDARRRAIYALSKISYWSEGAWAAHKATEYVAELLESSDTEIRTWTCQTLGNMTLHGVTSATQLGFELCTKIVSLLRDDDKRVRDSAIMALSKINRSSGGADTVAHITILKELTEHLNSSDPGLRQFTCSVLGNLAVSQYACFAKLNYEPCVRIARLLKDRDVEARGSAVHALLMMSYWREVAQIVGAQVVKYLPELLSSSNAVTLGSMCEIIGNLVLHTSTSVLDAELCVRVVSLMSHENWGVRRRAVHAVATISRSRQGAEMVRGTTIWAESVNSHAVYWENLAVRESASLILLGSKSYMRIVFLLRDNDIQVQRCAVYALSKMSHWPDAAQAMAETKAVQHIPSLLSSSDADTRRWTCEMVGNLASNGSLNTSEELSTTVVSLLSDDDKDVRKSALYALARIADSANGAQAIRETSIREYFPGLLKTPNPGVRRLACNLLAKLVTRDITSPGIIPNFVEWKLHECLQIVPLLSDKDIRVQRQAINILSTLSSQPHGAQVVIDAGALEYVPGLLSSSDAETRRLTCEMLAYVVDHKFKLDGKLCARVVVQLGDEDEEVRLGAILVLSKITRCRDGARTVGDTKIIEYVPNLLDSNNSRSLICETLGNLALYQALPYLTKSHQIQIPTRLREDNNTRESIDLREWILREVGKL
ncbi:hypothetical protein MVEN_00618300 [Mycena venus]|uniref:Vacuolar protein 8 n=1 Tax=Mycena venus TaxID=2733690 RepID=A0A8H6YRM4_9AGAR|nr:hypothetical protein MVEN_00618300 [Mycena venus]